MEVRGHRHHRNADLTFDAVTLTARTLTRVVTLSVELFEDADPSSGGL